jgi:hypothetical protein
MRLVLVLIATGVSFASGKRLLKGLVFSEAGRTTLSEFVPPAPEACSVAPDPTTDRGCLTPRMAKLATKLREKASAISCWDEHAWSPKSDHPKGRACDIFPGPGGQRPTETQKLQGDKLAESLKSGAPKNNVKYIIWYGKIWSVERSKEGWRDYDGGGIYDPQDISGGHFDHLHVSVF